MAVDGINNQNTFLINNTVMASIGGGAAGVTYGIMSRPYLKGVIPTDSFINKTIDNLAKSSNADAQDVGTFLKNSIEIVKNANTHEDMLKILDKPVDKVLSLLPDEQLESVLGMIKQGLNNAGEQVPVVLKEFLHGINSKEDIKLIANGLVHNKISQIPVTDFKGILKSVGTLISSLLFTVQEVFKKEAINLSDTEKAFADTAKNAASSIVKKSALKCGAAGAVLAGATGLGVSYALNNKSATAQNSEKV